MKDGRMKWSILVDGFRTCNERRLLILQMWIAKKYMHIPQIVERVTEDYILGGVFDPNNPASPL